ncbi:MAG: MopE-related protein [Thermodesulfobacteriota bacterium]
MKNNQKNRFAVFVFLALFCLSFLLMPVHAGATVFYVDKDATGAGNGTSWADAFIYLQDALAAFAVANPGPAITGDEIWVAAGTYYPDEGSGQTDNNRYSTFTLPKYARLYGGFDGTDGIGGGALEAFLSQRDPGANVTVLSGDLTQNDIGFTNNTENAYHVVTVNIASGRYVLDGFTVKAGYTAGAGGGIYISSITPTSLEIKNCTITMNYAGTDGGGMYVSSYASPILTNCIFTENTAGDSGGAIYVGENLVMGLNCNPVLTDCSFRANTAYYGGAMYNDGFFTDGEVNPVLTNCVFSGNSAIYGGAMYNYSFCYCEVSPVLTNCTFSGNKASSTFRGNEIYNLYSTIGFGSGPQVIPPHMINCIVWNDSPIFNSSSKATFTYCDIKGSGGSASWNTALGTDLGGNIDADPLFVSPPDPAGAPTTAGDVHLLEGSPCIDTGTATGAPATDIDDNPRDATPDMGADEYLPDTDGDGEPDLTDGCPYDPLKTDPGICGCGTPDTDRDFDGVEDCNDGCPSDPAKTAPGLCGCGTADTDRDGDASPDCHDACPDDPNKMIVGICGCGVADNDSDLDGTMDCNDECPDDADKVAPGACGCDIPDLDADDDGYYACEECEDDNAAVHPAAMEVCNDGIDNNCNGAVDEGCDTCVNADGDGYCADVDCDDNNAAVHPAAAEACNDGIDNDCDGSIDEDCCTDADGDGYCVGDDCDDTDPSINPGAEEIRGDLIDNNCNGFMDEVFGDGDGGDDGIVCFINTITNK